MDRNLISVGVYRVSEIFRRAGNGPDGTNIYRLWNLLMQNFGVGQPYHLLNNWRQNPGNVSLIQSVISLISEKANQNNTFYPAFESIIQQVLTVGEGEKLERRTAKGKLVKQKGFKPLIGPRTEIIKKIWEYRKVKNSGAGDMVNEASADYISYKGHTGRAAKKKAPKKKAAKKKSAAKKAVRKGPPKKKKGGKPQTGKEKIVATKPARPPKPIQCNFGARMASHILQLKPSPVTVIISRKTIGTVKKMIQANASALVDENLPLTIRLNAVSQIKIKGQKEFTVGVPEKSETLSFQVIGLKQGVCSLRVDVWQKHLNVCSLFLSPNCVKKVNSQKQIRTIAKKPVAASLGEDLIQLRISQREVGKSVIYDYQLVAEELGIFNEYSSPRINNPERYVQQLYKEIDKLLDDAGNSADEIQNGLKEFGADLFSFLFPEGLQKDLYANVNKIKSIQVISTEPFIPWELLVVRNPDEGKGVTAKDRFMGELGLTRWLYGWVAPREITIRKTKARYIIPDYTDPRIILPAAVNERKYLVDTFHARQVTGNADSIRKLLRQKGSFDLLHFCCHGEADTQKIMFSKLLLQEKKNPFPTYLNQVTITQAGKFGTDKNRPMVVLNACQAGRRGNALVGYGGFANAFLNGGAGVFIGSLWSIDDETALSFITTFYKSLRQGDNLAEATIKARRESAKRKDTTWISYTVYGNPFAKLKL